MREERNDRKNMTKEEIHAKAKEIAYRHFFCNVDKEDWPKDPDSILYSNEAANELDATYYLNEFNMTLWAPFEDYSITELVYVMENLIYNIERTFSK